MKTKVVSIFFGCLFSVCLFFLGACEPMAPEPLLIGQDDVMMAGRLAARVDELPADPKLQMAALRLLLAEERAPEALAVSLRLVRAKPEDCPAWRLRAQAFLILEDEGAAFDALRRCLNARPNDAETLFSLGGMLAARHGDEAASLEEAEQLWTHLLKQHPDFPQAPMIQGALDKIRLKNQMTKSKTDDGVNSP